MIRAVVDTNVVVSGILKGDGPPGRLLRALFERRFVAVMTAAQIAEVARVLAYPEIARRYHVRLEEADALAAALLVLSDSVQVPKVAVAASRDPDDDLLLACAVYGRADYLVTGDQDILSLGTFRGVEIVPPATFLTFLEH